jgi:uncharacterized membrane protein
MFAAFHDAFSNACPYKEVPNKTATLDKNTGKKLSEHMKYLHVFMKAVHIAVKLFWQFFLAIEIKLQQVSFVKLMSPKFTNKVMFRISFQMKLL